MYPSNCICKAFGKALLGIGKVFFGGQERQTRTYFIIKKVEWNS